MRILNRVIVFDAADVDAESAFWAGVLGGEVISDGDWHSVVVDGEWIIGVQRAPDHVPPVWPTPAADARDTIGIPAQQQQVHLDLHVDDLDEAGCRALTYGGRLVVPPRAPADNPDGDELFATYASPAGHLVNFGLHPGA